MAAVPQRVDASAALAVPGVKRVVTIEGHQNPTWLKPGVAVVADSTWAAMKGREALRVTWDEGEGRSESSDVARRRSSARWLRSRGKCSATRATSRAHSSRRGRRSTSPTRRRSSRTRRSSRRTASRTCTMGAARLSARCRCRRPARKSSPACSASRAKSVSVQMTRIGGGFGRRLMSDYAAEAAYRLEGGRRAGAGGLVARGRHAARLLPAGRAPSRPRRRSAPTDV